MDNVKTKCPCTCNSCKLVKCKDLQTWCENGDCKDKLVVTQCPKKCGIEWCDYGNCEETEVYSKVQLWQPRRSRTDKEELEHPTKPTSQQPTCQKEPSKDKPENNQQEPASQQQTSQQQTGEQETSMQSKPVATQCPRKCGKCTSYLTNDNISRFQKFFSNKNNDIMKAQMDDTIKYLLNLYKCLVSLDVIRPRHRKKLSYIF